MNPLKDLFDLNGDGELDGIETAFAYEVMFGEENDESVTYAGWDDGSESDPFDI